MSAKHSRITFLRSILEIFGIAFLRFPPIQRGWVSWLVAVNAASVFFVSHIEAQVALVAVGAAVLMQALIYQRKRFVRILGVTHVLWLPMLAWMLMRLPAIPAEEHSFRIWLTALMATNGFSLLIDTWDLTRFLRGERNPPYAW
jgi:hypothetical protein